MCMCKSKFVYLVSYLGVWVMSILQSSSTYAEHLNNRVYKEWKSTASKRLRDLVWKTMDEEITEWMPTELKKISTSHKGNRCIPEEVWTKQKNKTIGPKVGTFHTSGSISASQWARRMVVSFNFWFIQNNFLWITHVFYEGNRYFFIFFPIFFSLDKKIKGKDQMYLRSSKDWILGKKEAGRLSVITVLKLCG